jgi:hypothetical protein
VFLAPRGVSVSTLWPSRELRADGSSGAIGAWIKNVDSSDPSKIEEGMAELNL